MKCTCGTLMTTLSNGYTVCETCRDTRDNMRIERGLLLSQLNEAVELLRDWHMTTDNKFVVERIEKFLNTIEGGK